MHYNKFARVLRARETSSEHLLWRKLRNRKLSGLKFRRQYQIGPYIVDFISFEKRLIIKVDGTSHDDKKEYDKIRQKFLELEGFKVVRFRNRAVNESMDSVLAIINDACAC